MRKEQYEKIRSFFLLHKGWLGILKFLNQFLPYAVAFLYCVMIISLISDHDERIFRSLFIPLLVFLSGTWVRAKINAARPYEKGIIPLIGKETKGNSFPSRHLLSAGVIFACSIYLSRFAAILFIFSILIGICRILAGVHSFSDVFFGFLYGLFIGMFLFFL